VTSDPRERMTALDVVGCILMVLLGMCVIFIFVGIFGAIWATDGDFYSRVAATAFICGFLCCAGLAVMSSEL
jgi:hypothetical protein